MENTFEAPQDLQNQAVVETPAETPIETSSDVQQPNPFNYQPPEVNLVLAGTGLRLANYIIDLIVFYIAFFAGGVFLGIVFPSAIENLSDLDPFLDRILSIIFYAVYMGIIEVMTQGRSIGKYITGTKAVNYDGTNISAATAFARGLSRAVPFDQLSALGNPPSPWHDRWNNTYVIVIKSSTLP